MNIRFGYNIDETKSEFITKEIQKAIKTAEGFLGNRWDATVSITFHPSAAASFEKFCNVSAGEEFTKKTTSSLQPEQSSSIPSTQYPESHQMPADRTENHESQKDGDMSCLK